MSEEPQGSPDDIVGQHCFTVGHALGVPMNVDTPLHGLSIGVLVLRDGRMMVGDGADFAGALEAAKAKLEPAP